MSLAPRLTVLDERVLAAVPGDGGAIRAGQVAALVFGVAHYECEQCHRQPLAYWGGSRTAWLAKRPRAFCVDCWDRLGYDTPTAMLAPILLASSEDARLTREILHGLQCVGLVRCRRGWWRQARRTSSADDNR